jgi:dTDP-3-amino-3,4,6-trideoxy-alpha-D-glucose transaminase
LAAKLRALRCFGWYDEGRISQSLGFNSRLDEMQAAILTVLLCHLDEGNRERRMLAAEYRRLEGLGLTLPPDDRGAIFHQFAIGCDERDALRRYLSDTAGIGTRVHYYPALHQQPAFAKLPSLNLPETEKMASQLLSLPIQPEVAAHHVARIAEAVEKGIRQCRAL